MTFLRHVCSLRCHRFYELTYDYVGMILSFLLFLKAKCVRTKEIYILQFIYNTRYKKKAEYQKPNPSVGLIVSLLKLACPYVWALLSNSSLTCIFETPCIRCTLF